VSERRLRDAETSKGKKQSQRPHTVKPTVYGAPELSPGFIVRATLQPKNWRIAKVISFGGRVILVVVDPVRESRGQGQM